MKRTLTGISLVSILLLSACAGTGGIPAANPPAEFTAVSSAADRYVASVERKARLSGVHVQWVNPPQAKDSQ